MSELSPFFDGSVPDALALCQQERRLLLVHVCDASTSVGECWSESSVAAALESNHVLALCLKTVLLNHVLWADASSQGTEAAMQFMSIYPVFVFPTTYFIDVTRCAPDPSGS